MEHKTESFPKNFELIALVESMQRYNGVFNFNKQYLPNLTKKKIHLSTV